MDSEDGSFEVSEPTTPPERPPYWSDCENRNLPRLGLFIHDALQRRTEPKVPTDGSTPLSRSEFMDIVDLMQAKADDLKEDTTTPARPVYDGPPPPPPVPDATELLVVARRKRNEARERIAAAFRFRAGRNRIQQLREDVQKAERAITLVEDEAEARKKEFLQLRHEYLEAREPFERRVSAWEREVARAERRQRANEKRQALVDRARRRVQEAFRPKRGTDSQAPITRDFEIAPPDQQGDEHVRRYYRQVVGRDRLEGVFSQDRFEKMLALPRSGWQKGKAGFYGYIVLMFDHTERVVLECPVEGNAIYLLDSGEDRLLGMNKRQLRESGEAKRIFHTGSWYQRLKDELGIE
jgi:hypothetical protein